MGAGPLATREGRRKSARASKEGEEGKQTQILQQEMILTEPRKHDQLYVIFGDKKKQASRPTDVADSDTQIIIETIR